MLQYQQDLYHDLLSLTNDSEAFYYTDQTMDGLTYRIFNYRLASYTEFCKPSALECRGIMYEVDANGAASRLASMPMQKFFNLYENPSTIGLDLSGVVSAEAKADGSLISTFMHGSELRFKSKGSLYSVQAVASLDWAKKSNPDLYGALIATEYAGYTVNLEWCAPDNRIVLGYAKPQLIVLNARNRQDGSYMSREDLVSVFKSNVVDVVSSDTDFVSFVADIPNMVGIEGFVLTFDSGLRVKCKTDWYLSLHHTKDSITNPRRLFEVILDEGIDDLRAMFHEDKVAIQIMDEMQQKVDYLYNHSVNEIETFYTQHKHLDRKGFAIAGRDYFKQSWLFGVAMKRYLDQPIDYKATIKGKWKELGFHDTSTATKETE